METGVEYTLDCKRYQTHTYIYMYMLYGANYCNNQNISTYIGMSHWIDNVSFVDLERSLLSYIALTNIQIH